jgi:hypothetical protein
MYPPLIVQEIGQRMQVEYFCYGSLTNVRFTVKFVFDVIFEFSTLKDIENAFDSQMHIHTAHPKRKFNHPFKRDWKQRYVRAVSPKCAKRHHINHVQSVGKL